ncbi:MAG: trypco2 family protein [Halobacteriota archaeon]
MEKVDMSNDGINIDEIIVKVKRAIRDVERQSAMEDMQFKVDKLELTLKAFTSKDAGGKITLKMPIEVSLGGKITDQKMQTIELTLVPAEEMRTFEYEDIEKDLVEAIYAIKEGIRNAAVESPKFKLQEATVGLDFVLDKEGNISIIAQGSGLSQVTHSLKLYIKSVDPKVTN